MVEAHRVVGSIPTQSTLESSSRLELLQIVV